MLMYDAPGFSPTLVDIPLKYNLEKEKVSENIAKHTALAIARGDLYIVLTVGSPKSLNMCVDVILCRYVSF